MNIQGRMFGLRARRRPAAGGGFAGGNVSYGSIKAMVEDMVAGTPTAPTSGGTLTINSESLGSYDYTIKSGNQTISSFTNSNWFTTTEDSRSAFIVVDGNLTINSGQTLIPSNRKLFTVIYVDGDLTVTGDISMTARGANHSSGAGNVTAAAIRIATGTFSSVVNPQVPAAGASGATGSSATNAAGVAGTDGVDGETGGGASGGHNSSGTSAGGDGADGTSFSGGPGGGCAFQSLTDHTDGGADGGAGGNGSATDTCGGGAGNPGGSGATSGDDGTGGVLIIIVTGTFQSSAGAVSADGSAGGRTAQEAGGGSGGGSVTILYGTDSSGLTPTADGGQNPSGPKGGDGTARKLSL